MFFVSFKVFAEQKFEVKDDGNNGISSKIYFKDTMNHKGDTDSDGVFLYEHTCNLGELVIAEPKSQLYQSGVAVCSKSNDTVALKVTWKPLYANLIRKRDHFISVGDYATAALTSNEIAARTVDISDANREKVVTLESLAKHLELSESFTAVAYDPQQKREVATPQFVDAIKEFQVSKGLNASGVVDYETLSTAAGRDIGDVMYSKVK